MIAVTIVAIPASRPHCTIQGEWRKPQEETGHLYIPMVLFPSGIPAVCWTSYPENVNSGILCLSRFSFWGLRRMLWSFSRDGAVPGHNFWHRVNRYTGTPINSV